MNDNRSKTQSDSWVDNPQTPNRIFYTLIALCIIVFFSDLAYHKHAHFAFEESLGFHALFGFGAYLTIVNCAKALRLFVKRPEDYYDE